MAKLSVVTACCSKNEVTKQFFDTTLKNCSSSDRELILYSNGSTPDEENELKTWLNDLKSWKVKSFFAPKPLGSTKPLNEAAKAATNDIIAIVHNDLLIKDANWDQAILQFFDMTPQAGVVGFVGAKVFGTLALYKEPYEVSQLIRRFVFSNIEDWQFHGERTKTPRQVIVLDGMALICRRSEFLAWGGFDETYFHHMYDNDLCLTALKAGKLNYVVPVVAKHLSGQTVNSSTYQNFVKPTGGDERVHENSHLYFYEKWRGFIPLGTTLDS